MLLDCTHPREIDGNGRTVRALLGNEKYSIDYDRVIQVAAEQVAEPPADLAAKFLESHEPGHERARRGLLCAPSSWGSVIISDKGGA